MKKQSFTASLLLLIILFGACKDNNKKQTATTTENVKKEQRIISLNGAITEIVYALGHGNKLVGRDVTSTYPNWVKDSVKDLGHVRSLSVEPIMALHPTLILASDKSMNPNLKNSIESSGVNFEVFEQEFSVEGTKKLIQQIAGFFGDTQPRTLLDKIDEELAKVEAFKNRPKVLFVYARGAGTLMVAGKGTPMEEMIRLAGGENAVQDFNDFKPLTAEALLNANPDVILMFDSGLQSLGGKNGLLGAVPSLLQTNAGKNQAIITMDGALLSDFGPRVGKAVYQLNQLLKPYAK